MIITNKFLIHSSSFPSPARQPGPAAGGVLKEVGCAVNVKFFSFLSGSLALLKSSSAIFPGRAGPHTITVLSYCSQVEGGASRPRGDHPSGALLHAISSVDRLSW